MPVEIKSPNQIAGANAGNTFELCLEVSVIHNFSFRRGSAWSLGRFTRTDTTTHLCQRKRTAENIPHFASLRYGATPQLRPDSARLSASSTCHQVVFGLSCRRDGAHEPTRPSARS